MLSYGKCVFNTGCQCMYPPQSYYSMYTSTYTQFDCIVHRSSYIGVKVLPTWVGPDASSDCRGKVYQLSTHFNDRKENRTQRALRCNKIIKHSVESGNKEVWAILPIFNFYIHIDLSRACFYQIRENTIMSYLHESTLMPFS